MKTELYLDYQTVLANQAAPVHFAVRFHAEEVTGARPQPAAFCVVLDRSGSMRGEKLDQARKATALAVRNLRRNDLFGLVIFDDTAQTIVPLNFRRYGGVYSARPRCVCTWVQFRPCRPSGRSSAKLSSTTRSSAPTDCGRRE